MWRDSDYDREKNNRLVRPFGIPLSELDFPLDPREVETDYYRYEKELKRRVVVDGKITTIATGIKTKYTPGVYYRAYRDMAVEHRLQIEDARAWKYGTITPKWLWDHGQDLSLKQLEGLSTSTIGAFMFCIQFSGRLQREIELIPHLYYLWKLENSAWHWGHRGFTWQLKAKCHDLIRRFDFGDDFEVTLNHTNSCNKRGHAYFYPETEKGDDSWYTWLDGPLAFFVTYKGKHVLTISFSVNGKGFCVHQIQLKNKKGNRWLYSLGMPLFDYVLGRIKHAARGTGLPIWLADGESIAAFVQENKRDEDRNCAEWPEQKARIVATYNQELADFERTKYTRRSTITFRRLVRKRSPQAAASSN